MTPNALIALIASAGHTTPMDSNVQHTSLPIRSGVASHTPNDSQNHNLMEMMNKHNIHLIGILAAVVLVGIPSLLLKGFLYSVEFTHGDSHYVRAEDIQQITKDEIVFKSLILRRTVRGNDYRITEPFFDSYKTLNINNK